MSASFLDLNSFKESVFRPEEYYKKSLGIDLNIDKLVATLKKTAVFKGLSSESVRALVNQEIFDSSRLKDKNFTVHRSKIANALQLNYKKNHENFLSYVLDSYVCYELSTRSGLGCKVLGPKSLRKDKIICRNFGKLADVNLPAELPSKWDVEPCEEAECEASDSSSSALSFSEESCKEAIEAPGAILGGGIGWNILKNDSSILGAIHACQPVYITYSKDELLSLPDSELHQDDFIRVLPREIIQLTTAGYMALKVDHALDGYVLVCSDLARARNFTMENMVQAVSLIQTAESVRETLSSIGEIDYQDYVSACL